MVAKLSRQFAAVSEMLAVLAETVSSTIALTRHRRTQVSGGVTTGRHKHKTHTDVVCTSYVLCVCMSFCLCVIRRDGCTCMTSPPSP